MTATAYLTTGWEPDLADADSICLRWLRHWSEQVAVLVGATGGRVHRDERYLLADRGRPFSYFNAAVLLRPGPTTPRLLPSSTRSRRASRAGPATSTCGASGPLRTCTLAAGNSTGTRRC